MVSPKNSESPKIEADYIEADNEPYDECNHELFCVAEKDSDYIDIDDLY